MIDIYLSEPIDGEETLTLDNVDTANFTEDGRFLVLYNKKNDDSVTIEEVGRIKGGSVVGYYIYED